MQAPRQHLTAQQQLALRTDRNISVTAGAGSGKTTILVERYLKLILEEQVDVRHVLAITFTEKAAAEMTERVARMIRRRLETVDDPKARARLLNLRERLNAAQISTIHAFCARILREFAVASGIDPDFSVLNEYQQDLLLNESIDQLLERLDTRALESPYRFEEWQELLRQVPPYTLRQIFHTALQHAYEMQQLQARYEQFSDEQLLDDLQTIFFTRLEQDLDSEALLAAVVPLIGELNASDANRPGLKPNGRQAFELMEQLAQIADPDAQREIFWQALIDLSQLLTTGKGEPFKSPTSIGLKAELRGAYELIKELSEAIHPLYRFAREYSATVPGRADLLCCQAIRKILFLYEQVATYYREQKEERGLLDFDDLQLIALEMLRNRPEVRNTLRNRYRHVMVDEFQDTNQMQWELIALLGQYEEDLQQDKFFVVGDPKQSIYGFRNADVRVFQDVKALFAAGSPSTDSYEGNILLTDSFRFLPAVNKFVNFLFRQILGSDPANPFDVPYDELETRREVSGAGYIEVAFLGGEKTAADRSQEAYIARTIRSLLDGQAGERQCRVYERSGDGESPRPLRPGDIAILIPRRTHLLALESKLRQYGIPFKTIGGVGFYRRQEIFDVYHLLRYLDNPGDDIALVGLLRSPLAGISDAGLFFLSLEEGSNYRERLANTQDKDLKSYPEADRGQIHQFRRQLTRWEQRRDRLSLSALLNEIFEESFYRATVAAEWNGEQLLANLDKIVEMARDYEQGGFMALADFIEMLHRTINLDPREGEAQIALEDEGTVKIMTIHQAKGLEFPVVFCPYLQQTPRHDLRKLRFDPDLGLSLKIRDPQNGYRESQPFLYELINFRRKQKDIAELKRLFYVAVTRARDQVYLVGSHGNNELARENCLAWTAAALEIDPEAPAAGEITPEGDLVIEVVLEGPALPAPDVTPQDVQAGLTRLEATVAEAEAAPAKQEEAHNRYRYLRPVQDSPRGVTFSATQLLTIHADENQYLQRYHLGFFENDYEFLKQGKDEPAAKNDAENLSLLKGKIVHKILEEGLPVNQEEIAEKLEKAFFYYEVFDPREQGILKEDIPALIGNFAQTEFAKTIFGAAEWKVEISLTMRLGGDYLTGTLDRIYRTAEGHWEVADYKTNNIRAAQVAEAGEKYMMQMKSYAMLMAQLFPGQGSYPVSLYFMKPQQEYRQLFTPAHVQDIQEEFLGLIKRIKQNFPYLERLDV